MLKESAEYAKNLHKNGYQQISYTWYKQVFGSDLKEDADEANQTSSGWSVNNWWSWTAKAQSPFDFRCDVETTTDFCLRI